MTRWVPFRNVHGFVVEVYKTFETEKKEERTKERHNQQQLKTYIYECILNVQWMA